MTDELAKKRAEREGEIIAAIRKSFDNAGKRGDAAFYLRPETAWVLMDLAERAHDAEADVKELARLRDAIVSLQCAMDLHYQNLMASIPMENFTKEDTRNLHCADGVRLSLDKLKNLLHEYGIPYGDDIVVGEPTTDDGITVVTERKNSWDTEHTSKPK